VQVPGYEILRELGRGGMGVVYLARQEGLDRLVALKMVLHGGHAGAEEVSRFRTEAQAIARLRHPNIVQVFAVGTCEGLPFFAMEYCSGGSLAQHFATGSLTPSEAAALVASLARAIQVAHTAGLVHRDLKPANVLLASNDPSSPLAELTPKITDFGLAKKLDVAEGMTQTGAVLGTPSYMAPEQARGQVHAVGPAADVWALGALLYEALTGQPPFRAATVYETLEQVQKQEPLSPRVLRPDLPDDLEAIVLQCLEKEARQRYASADELANDLERWRSGDPVRARRQGRLYRLRKRLRRHRRTVVALALAVPLLLIAWLGLADAGVSVPGGTSVRTWLDRHEWSLLRPAPSEARLREVAADQRRTLTNHLLQKTMTRNGWVSLSPKKWEPPDVWTQTQTTVALVLAPETPPDQLKGYITNLHGGLFESAAGCGRFLPGYGWPRSKNEQPSAEGCAWALWALAAALNRPGAVKAEERGRLLARLDQLQQTLEAYRSCSPSGQATGAWNLFAQQENPDQANIYISAMMCHGLIELHRGRLPWRGSVKHRQELLTELVRWLLDNFDGRGWSAPGKQTDDFNDGLTLQIFSALLKAEAAGLVQLPEPMLEQVPRHLADCAARPLNYPIDFALFRATFRPPGMETITEGLRPVRMLWHPWAIDCAARWLHRAERTGAPHDEVVRTRRVLGHLLLSLGEGALAEARTGFTYVVAETLVGLAALEDLD
jgi:hypothetical protein